MNSSASNGLPPSEPSEEMPEVENGDVEKRKKKKPKKKPQDGRSVETMFRVSYRASLVQIELADGKANILIGTNGLMMSAVIIAGGLQSQHDAFQSIPAACLVITCMTSIAFALFAVCPRIVGAKTITSDDIRSDKVSLLFFGSAARFDGNEYEELMTELIGDQGRLRRHLIQNLYGISRGISFKFRMVRNAYYSLVVGLITTGIVFVAFSMLSSPE